MNPSQPFQASSKKFPHFSSKKPVQHRLAQYSHDNEPRYARLPRASSVSSVQRFVLVNVKVELSRNVATDVIRAAATNASVGLYLSATPATGMAYRKNSDSSVVMISPKTAMMAKRPNASAVVRDRSISPNVTQ